MRHGHLVRQVAGVVQPGGGRQVAFQESPEGFAGEPAALDVAFQFQRLGQPGHGRLADHRDSALRRFPQIV
jgi:hypothetical protein